MFVFGDSNSDTGRWLQLQGTKPASPPYFEGRHSNGPVAVEHVATALGLTAPGQFIDYAVGGALSGKNEFRSLLPTAMQTLDATLPGEIDYFSARPVLLQMIAAGNPYGFTQTSSANPCYTGTLMGGGSVCGNPASYVFWDANGHLTAPAHQILGNAMIAAVPEPETYAMLLAGLGLLALVARRRGKPLAHPA